jgi:hypothetical protein
MTISTTTLKNAARAIECDLWTDPDGANYLAKDGAILRRWEPATNDTDAFRLAANLRMQTATTLYAAFADSEDEEIMVRIAFEADGRDRLDPFTAMRHAITVCASKIGESIKCQ